MLIQVSLKKFFFLKPLFMMIYVTNLQKKILEYVSLQFFKSNDVNLCPYILVSFSMVHSNQIINLPELKQLPFFMYFNLPATSTNTYLEMFYHIYPLNLLIFPSLLLFDYHRYRNSYKLLQGSPSLADSILNCINKRNNESILIFTKIKNYFASD